MINYTNIKIPKKYEPFIHDVDYWEKEFILNLRECCDIDGGSHLYFYNTQDELLNDLSSIWIIPSEKEYVYLFGESLLKNYREDYKRINGEYPSKE